MPREITVSADTDSHGNRLRNRSKLKKVLVPVVLAVIGMVLLVGALALYPSESQPSAPPYATLLVSTTFPIENISYMVTQVSSSIAKIQIGVSLSTLRPPKNAPGAVLLVAPPLGTNFTTCPPSFCHIAQSADQHVEIWDVTLSFQTETAAGYSTYGEAVLNLYVKSHSYGVSFNGITAYAAIPAVTCAYCGNTTLLTKYDIPGADTYDWSSFPTQFADGTHATWSGAASGVATGRTATGINHANQTKDSNKTFFAGALLGLAGAALLAAVQEALHANE